MTRPDRPAEPPPGRSPLPAPHRMTGRAVLAVALAGTRARPLRAVLSGLGIAVGIAALVTVLGITRSSEQQLLDQIHRLGTNLLTAQAGESPFGGSARLSPDAPGMTARIDSVRSVTAVGVLQGVTIRRTDKIPSVETNGIAVAAARRDLLATLGGTVRSGDFLNAATERYPAVVLGSVAGARLGIDRPGQQVYADGQWLTVAGVLDPLSLAPEIDRSALVGWPAALRLFRFDGNPTTVYLRATDAAVPRVASLLGATVDPLHPESVQVRRPSDALVAQLAAKSAFRGLFFGLGLVALLVGGIGVANTMVISVLERRAEIGLRRALGAGRGHIRAQFFAESVILSLLGGGTGVLTGLAITLGYASARGWPLVLPWQPVTAGALAAALVGTVAGLYPARRAASVAPTQALTAS